MWPACASPAKPGEIVFPAIWPSRPIAISPDGNRNSPTLMQGPYAAMPERLIPYAKNARTHTDGDLELAGIMAERTAGLTNPDDAPAVPEHPVSVAGDLWLLGRHRL